jgi:large conductance mechanosensitive channel
MFKEFREFAIKGSVIDMAVGIIIGAAFGKIVSSLVADVLMPPIGLLLGNVDFTNLFLVLKQGGVQAGPYATLSEAQGAGAVTMNAGLFLNTVVSFLIVAVCVFLLVKAVNRLKREEPSGPATIKACPYCCSSIPMAALRCPQCTSSLAAVTEH